MIFLLDTNAVSALTKGNLTFLERGIGFTAADFVISSIVAHEMFFGIYNSARVAANADEAERLLAAIDVVPFETEDARAAGRIRAELQARGTPIGPYDVLIAGQALARDLTLISRNMREFSRVPGLRVENWMG